MIQVTKVINDYDINLKKFQNIYIGCSIIIWALFLFSTYINNFF